MKATMNRVDKIKLKLDRLTEMMSGDNKEFIGIKTGNKLGMTKLRRA